MYIYTHICIHKSGLKGTVADNGNDNDNSDDNGNNNYSNNRKNNSNANSNIKFFTHARGINFLIDFFSPRIGAGVFIRQSRPWVALKRGRSGKQKNAYFNEYSIYSSSCFAKR